MGVLKEKFGTLRVQFRARVSTAIEALVAQAGGRSAEICELCGAPAQLDRERELGKWAEALCESCHKAHRPPPRIQDKSVLPVWMLGRDGKL